jgi:hypothetical protein
MSGQPVKALSPGTYTIKAKDNTYLAPATSNTVILQPGAYKWTLTAGPSSNTNYICVPASGFYLSDNGEDNVLVPTQSPNEEWLGASSGAYVTTTRCTVMIMAAKLVHSLGPRR